MASNGAARTGACGPRHERVVPPPCGRLAENSKSRVDEPRGSSCRSTRPPARLPSELRPCAGSALENLARRMGARGGLPRSRISGVGWLVDSPGVAYHPLETLDERA